MKIEANVLISAPKEAIWQVITDITNAQNNITAIKRIELLETPAEGLVGLKWRETRVMYGKEATETMWIIDSEPQVYYRTEAFNHGTRYFSEMRIIENDVGCVLNMSFEGVAESLFSKVFSKLFAGMMTKSMQGELVNDLNDIKGVVEGRV